VYDAAIDRERWVDAVRLATGFVGCFAGVMGGVDFLKEDSNLIIQWGYPEERWDAYLNSYFHLNPMNQRGFRQAIGEVVPGRALVDWDAYLRTDFHREWAAPMGLVDVMQGTIDRSASGIALLTCARHESAGLLGARELRRMRLVVPHFRRAFLIAKVLDLHAARATAFAEVIDKLHSGVFLLNAGGHVVHANQTGYQMLDLADPLSLSGGRLTAEDKNAQAVLDAALAVFAGGENTSEAPGTSIGLRGSNDRHFTAHLLPLTSGARHRMGVDFSSTVALFVREASIDIPAAIRAAGQMYGFTLGEARVLTALMEVGGVGAVATMLHLGKRTVQTHLEHLFDKTGTRRQAELVKLIAGYGAPLASREG